MSWPALNNPFNSPGWWPSVDSLDLNGLRRLVRSGWTLAVRLPDGMGWPRPGVRAVAPKAFIIVRDCMRSDAPAHWEGVALMLIAPSVEIETCPPI